MKLFRRVVLCVPLTVFLLSCATRSPQQVRYPVIPKLQELVEKSGSFEINDQTRILRANSSDDVVAVSSFLAGLLKPATGFALPESEIGEQDENTNNSIELLIDSNIAGPEGQYQLKINSDAVQIRSASAIGLFYGVQTIRQLLPGEIERSEPASSVKWIIPNAEIADGPRFSYRGLHLDVGRHLFPVSFIKKYIDVLALHKMNFFHWHLTEDQGWRIEIKKYPELTATGSYRKETLIGHGSRPPFEFDGKRYGGFYSQDEVRDIVAYAQSRFVTVIPEIELPGHSLAALSAYPELGCTGGPYEVASQWGIFDDVYCAGNEKTFTFLEDVLSEVADLFPGQYIHIGGDECPKKRWEACPKCQARMRSEGLKNEHELQSYFISRIEKFLSGKGRNIVGWDEILEGGLAPRATVMSWRGTEGGIAAARQGHDVIMTPYSHCYLDYYQADPENEPLAIGGFLTLEKVYSYEPVPDELNTEQAKHVLGAQGNVWTEYMKTSDHVEYMAYPRAVAMSEVGWAQKGKRDFKEFKQRLDHHYKRLKELKVNYYQKKTDE